MLRGKTSQGASIVDGAHEFYYIERLLELRYHIDGMYEESWDRSDTDGFLTQWACNLSSSEASERARILRNGGMARFAGLYQGDRRVKARVIETKFGTSWLLHDDEKELIEVRGKPFLPTGESSRVLKKLGLQQRPEWDLAWAKVTGSGTGLSGSAWVGTFRCGDKWGADAVPRTQDEIDGEVY